MPPKDAVTITIAVLTYRRPDDLRDALDALLDHCAALPVLASILVVDNDTVPSAAAIVSRYPKATAVRYVHEPAPGIASARNRAFAAAGDAKLLVFIDDDERPEPGWLLGLVSTWHATRAAAVVGPVVSRFSIKPEPWIVAGGFFTRRRHPTGTRVSVAATNNLLLDLEQVRALGLSFDDRFGISGGSDTLFTRQLHAAGATMIWCDEAIVTDVVPAERLTRRWVLRRAIRMGNSVSRARLAVTASQSRRALERLQLTAEGSSRIAGGGLRWVSGSVIGSMTLQAGGARTFSRGLGMVVGAWGHTCVEYGRPATMIVPMSPTPNT